MSPVRSQEPGGAVDGDQEADLLTRRRDVDPDHAAVPRQRRPAAHAGIERAGKMNFGIERVLEQAIVSSFNNGQAEIARMLGVTESTVENDGVKGMRLIMKALREDDDPAVGQRKSSDEPARNRRRD